MSSTASGPQRQPIQRRGEEKPARPRRGRVHSSTPVRSRTVRSTSCRLGAPRTTAVANARGPAAPQRAAARSAAATASKPQVLHGALRDRAAGGDLLGQAQPPLGGVHGQGGAALRVRHDEPDGLRPHRPRWSHGPWVPTSRPVQRAQRRGGYTPRPCPSGARELRTRRARVPGTPVAARGGARARWRGAACAHPPPLSASLERELPPSPWGYLPGPQGTGGGTTARRRQAPPGRGELRDRPRAACTRRATVPGTPVAVRGGARALYSP
ncbi:hypothetical protein SALBM217S_00585 [Streptomyces griseoloalbus]